MDACMNRCMDGWMNESTDGWIDRWTDGWYVVPLHAMAGWMSSIYK